MTTEEKPKQMIKSINEIQRLDQEFIETTHERLNILEDKINDILNMLRIRLQ